MISAISGITRELAMVALDGLSLRHQAIASNIANRDTPGYSRLTVEFEAQLASILSAHDAGVSDGATRSNLNQAAGGLHLSPAAEPEVRLDTEMGDLTRNTLQYQALLTALQRVGSMTHNAISGGR